MQDVHGHLVVDHDLYNHEGRTEDGIAEAFIEFAKKEKLSFFESSPSVTPFDAVRYQQLMDGLEAVEAKFCDTQAQKVHRFEAEFYIAKTGKFNQFLSGAEVIDFVQYGTSKDLNENAIGYPVLRLNEFESNFTGTPAKYCHLIDEGTFQSLKLRKGDVLICRTNGNPKLVGKSALVPKDTNFAFASYVFRVQPKKHLISSEVLTVFLNSKYGRQEIEKYSMTGNQTNFSPAKFREIQVPHFLDAFQKIINKLVEKAYQFIENSKLFYQQAEDLLLSELGLKDWQPTEETFAVKSFAESFLSSGRLDADYYQPKYDQVEEVIKGCGFPSQNLGSLIDPIQNGFDYREYTQEGTPYIRVGDVKKGQINFESAVKIPLTMADVDKPVGLQLGDILFTRKGSFGNSAVVTELEVNGIISSEIMLVRLTSASKKEILPEYVSLFLNSKFGYLQVERRVHGVAYYSISQPDLANLLIPILPEPQQQKIVDKIKSSFSLKLKSKQLLEIAKTGVERAIETDEATAIIWMNQQLEALKVKLT